jgi:hypothetical protein
LITITIIEELNFAEESTDPQNSIRLYISEEMKLYYEAAEETVSILKLCKENLRFLIKRLS